MAHGTITRRTYRDFKRKLLGGVVGRMGFPVVCLKDGNFYRLFDSLKEVHEYFYINLKNEQIKEDIWKAINFGIDEHKPWNYKNVVYDFRSTKEVKDERANRKTRKQSESAPPC